MADEVTPENVAEQPAEEISTQEQIPAPETPPEEAPETTPEIPANQTAEEKKAWDKDRQKRDKEAADERKRLEAERIERIETNLAKLIEIQVANTTKTPAQQEQVKDEIEEAETLLESLSKVEDPFDAKNGTVDALKKFLTVLKSQNQKLKQRDQQDAVTTAEKQQWQGFLKDNPDVPLESAIKLRDDAYEQATKAGYTGEFATRRMNEIFTEKLPTIKKSKTSPPVISKPAQTATKPGSTAPPGTKVTPSGSGVRAIPSHINDAKNKLAEMMLKKG